MVILCFYMASGSNGHFVWNGVFIWKLCFLINAWRFFCNVSIFLIGLDLGLQHITDLILFFLVAKSYDQDLYMLMLNKMCFLCKMHNDI